MPHTTVRVHYRLHGLGMLDPWMAPLLYEVMQYVEAEGYWYSDGKFHQRSEWRFEDGDGQLYNLSTSERYGPQKA